MWHSDFTLLTEDPPIACGSVQTLVRCMNMRLSSPTVWMLAMKWHSSLGCYGMCYLCSLMSA